MNTFKRTAAVGVAALMFGASAWGQKPGIESKAGTWKTWVIGSGSELRLEPPPGAASSRSEARWLKEFMSASSAQDLAQMKYWDTGAPPYRWIEMVSDRMRDGRLAVSITSFRAYALLTAAMSDATVASWDTKYAYNRQRPSEIDPQIVPRVETAPSPSYPSEHAAVAGAAARVLSYLFPADAAYFESMAEEAARSRLTAGVHLPSDVEAGLKLGRMVGDRVVEYGRQDRTDAVWTGTVPSGPGLWTGTNPGFVTAPLWKPWVLSGANEFRPGPPPAHDSAERAGEIAELKGIARSFATNAPAFFWQTVDGIHVWWFDFVHRKLFEEKLDRNAPFAARAYAMVALSHYDSHIVSGDAKYTYWVNRPHQQDGGIVPVFPAPNFPAYPSNHSTHSSARAEVLAYLFPTSAGYIRGQAQAAGLSRLLAGIHFRSDHTAGMTAGAAVGQKVVAAVSGDEVDPR